MELEVSYQNNKGKILTKIKILESDGMNLSNIIYNSKCAVQSDEEDNLCFYNIFKSVPEAQKWVEDMVDSFRSLLFRWRKSNRIPPKRIVKL